MSSVVITSASALSGVALQVPDKERHLYSSEKLLTDLQPPTQQHFAQRMELLGRYFNALSCEQRLRGCGPRKGIARGSEVDLTALDPSVRVILVGDLHGELDSFRKILLHNNNLAAIAAGGAVIVLLGDLVHPVRGDLNEMADSIRLKELFMALKCAYPQNVFSVVGNHDPLHELCVKKKADSEGTVTFHEQSRWFLEALTGELLASGANRRQNRQYQSLYAECTQQSPYVMVARGSVATHAGPITGYSREQIRSCSPIDDADLMVAHRLGHTHKERERMEWSVYAQAVWSRYMDKERPLGSVSTGCFWTDDSVRECLAAYGQPNGHLFVGHSPPRNKEQWHRALMRPSPEGNEASATVIVASGQKSFGYAELLDGKVSFQDVG